MMFHQKLNLKQYSRKNIILFLIGFELLWGYSFSWLAGRLFGQEIFEISPLNESGLFTIFVSSVIFAPLIETFIFQYCIIELVFKININKKYQTILALLLSSLAFGLIHTYHAVYFVFALISGIIYATVYIYMKRTGYMNSFMTVYIMHLAYNLSGFVFFDWLGS